MGFVSCRNHIAFLSSSAGSFLLQLIPVTIASLVLCFFLSFGYFLYSSVIIVSALLSIMFNTCYYSAWDRPRKTKRFPDQCP